MVVPDSSHVVPEVEIVVERTERFWIVEEPGGSGTRAAELDSRSHIVKSRVFLGSFAIC